MSLGCIGHLPGLAEESRGWGLWDPHNPPRLWDRPKVCMGRPSILSESPSPGVSDPLLPPPAVLLTELRPGGLVPTSSEGFVCIPDQGAPWTHCSCRSWIYWWILIQTCTQVSGDLCPPPARQPWQGNPQPSPGDPGLLIQAKAQFQAILG